jgi:serine/threonine protein kinase
MQVKLKKYIERLMRCRSWITTTLLPYTKHLCRNKEVILIMEYAGGGELLDKVEEKGSLNELDARDIFRQIANAISY